MSVLGLKVGPFEIVGPAFVPEPGRWYLARRSGPTRKQPEAVLVRVLPGDAPADERAAVLRQYEALKGIEDARVPQPVAYYEGLGALAIDAVSGAPLLDAARRGVPLTQATLLDVLLEVAETLQRVHHRHRHHGHLDPEQIVLAPEGAVWIFGFGTPDAAPDPRWTPPERARGEPGSALTDQWSLGLVALLLAPGAAPPSDGPEPVAARVEALDRDWPALGRLVRRMADPHPANRFPSLHPVRQELLALARRVGGTSDRRALAQQLSRLRGSPAADPPTEPPPAVPPPAPVAEVDPVPLPLPLPAPAPALVRPDPQPIPEPAPPRRHGPLPAEQIPIVRPDVSEEVPLAAIGRPDPTEDPLPPSLTATDPGLVTAPTAVPTTDSGEDAPTDPGTPPMTLQPRPAVPEPPSMSEAWFDPTTEPEPDPSLGLSGASPVLPAAEPSLAPSEEAEPAPAPSGPSLSAPPAEPFPITRIAPVLALAFAALASLWLATRLW